MAAAAKTATQVPGAKDATQLPRGTPMAVFVRGMDAFTSALGENIKLKGVEGDTVEARLIGVKPGRLFALAQEFMTQAPTSIAQSQIPSGYAFQDVAFFKSLEAVYGREGVYPIEPYTVLIVMVDVPPPTLPGA